MTSQADEFLAKSQRLLEWIEVECTLLVEHGSVGNEKAFERVFFNCLTQISSLHEAIASAAKLARQLKWREHFNEERASDELLLYLWKARDSDVHSLIKWKLSAGGVKLQVMDEAKYARVARQFYQVHDPQQESVRVMMFLFESTGATELADRLLAREMPSSERLAQAGVSLVFDIRAIALDPFETRNQKGSKVVIGTPMRHCGKSEPTFHAQSAVEKAIEYYRLKLNELRSLVSKSTS